MITLGEGGGEEEGSILPIYSGIIVVVVGGALYSHSLTTQGNTAASRGSQCHDIVKIKVLDNIV